MGLMGRGGGLFLYLSKINYDGMINCERWKENHASFYVSLKGTMGVGKITTNNIIIR